MKTVTPYMKRAPCTSLQFQLIEFLELQILSTIRCIIITRNSRRLFKSVFLLSPTSKSLLGYPSDQYKIYILQASALIIIYSQNQLESLRAVERNFCHQCRQKCCNECINSLTYIQRYVFLPLFDNNLSKWFWILNNIFYNCLYTIRYSDRETWLATSAQKLAVSLHLTLTWKILHFMLYNPDFWTITSTSRILAVKRYFQLLRH